ncbi:isoprenylcysteine carboxylmethyltransferase family protein [Candidatus Woesearchaeota archaeon]|nr:isoprenylcysteine carboxylmethyltransferase family protein [Candidatus Woesearchaeota archaeon]
MFNSIFKIVYFIEVVFISIIRKIYTVKFRKLQITVDRKSKLDITFLSINAIGMLVPFLYVFSTKIDFANYYLPDWIGWVGAVLFFLAALMLWKVHLDLGRNWTPTPGIRKEHKLITDGIFKHIRHPMYSAHILWAIAQILMLHNWIAGYSFIITSLPFYIIRIRSEEKMMLEEFGDKYREYIKRTGRIFPSFKLKSNFDKRL